LSPKYTAARLLFKYFAGKPDIKGTTGDIVKLRDKAIALRSLVNAAKQTRRTAI